MSVYLAPNGTLLTNSTSGWNSSSSTNTTTPANGTIISNITNIASSVSSSLSSTSASTPTSTSGAATVATNLSTKLSAPYPPTTAGLGGTPTTSLDVPIISVFLFLFIVGAITHMTIFKLNMKHGVKFVLSAVLFGFCMARITACTMRLVWSTHHSNISVAIAAQVFVQVGVILLFIINLIFAQRILRAVHPLWAWKRPLSIAFKAYYASIILMLIAIIVCSIQSFFTLSHNTRRIDRDVQLVGGIYFAVAAFVPIPILFIAYLIRQRTPVEKFSSGRFRTKVAVLVFSSVLLTLGAAFRAGTNFLPRPISDPAWYHSKSCFYISNFTIEIIIVYLYAIMRVDRRFVVPNGCHGPGDYSRGRMRDMNTSSADTLQGNDWRASRIEERKKRYLSSATLLGSEAGISEKMKSGREEWLQVPFEHPVTPPKEAGVAMDRRTKTF
ncbi:hypothetical protein B0J14DRAFT_353920 [Halenospora varia]|nr:hypothetical protein B0J14DRAFT_353920 [Halenospora varia]